VSVSAIAPKESILEIVQIFRMKHSVDETDGIVIYGKITVNGKNYIGIVNNNFTRHGDGNLMHDPLFLKRIY